MIGAVTRSGMMTGAIHLVPNEDLDPPYATLRCQYGYSSDGTRTFATDASCRPSVLFPHYSVLKLGPKKKIRSQY